MEPVSSADVLQVGPFAEPKWQVFLLLSLRY